MNDPGALVLARLAGFAAMLRENGFAVGVAESADAARILASPLAARPTLLGPALRALFSADAAEWRKFDAIFVAWWLNHRMKLVTIRTGAAGRRGPRTLRDLAEAGTARVTDTSHCEGADASTTDPSARRAGASRAASLARIDFRHLAEPDALAAAHTAAAALAAALRTRRTRRVCAAHQGRRLDMRRTIRASIAHGGTPLDRIWRRRRTRPMKLVVLLDASGSMSLYTAVFARFLHGVIHRFAAADAFLFHTRLVQVSDALRERDPRRAVDRLALLAEGVGGGTRIGDCLAQFRRLHARRVLTGRSVLMIISDGYDTGEPCVVGQTMAALRRRCRRIVWLNPMLGWPGYAPVARGMTEALPHIDLFAPANTLDSLRRLAPYLAKLNA